MATVNDILVRAIKKIGAYKAGRSVPGEEMGDAFEEYKDMLSEWATAKLLRPFITRETLSLVAGTGSYTIGTGGALSTVRPDKVLDAYVRSFSSEVDYHLNVDNSLSQYNMIDIKDVQSIPTHLFYDSQYTLGQIYIYPVPVENYTLTLESSKPVVLPTALTDTFNLPDEYKNMCIYSLAVRLAPSYGIPEDAIASVIRVAGQLVAQMKAKNSNPPMLVSDAGIGQSYDQDWWKSGLR